ncbi:MAG: FIST N-terminal domain-containing protein [Nitrospirota bacterium]
MPTHVGIGKSNNRSAFKAGEAAATVALEKMGQAMPHFVFLFTTTGYNQEELLQGVRSIIKACPLSGCSAEGIITSDGSDEGSHAVSVTAIWSDTISFQPILVEGVSRNIESVAMRLFQKCTEGMADARLLMLLPDGLTTNCTHLLSALDAVGFPSTVSVVGGAAGDMLQFNRTYQYHQGGVYSDSLSAVLIGGKCTAEIEVSHGCTPVGIAHKITQSNGGNVQQMDNRPIWDIFKQYLGKTTDNFDAYDLRYLYLGEILPEKNRPEKNSYIIRVPLKLDKEKGSMFFPGDLVQGGHVQLMRQDAQIVEAAALSCAQKIVSRRPGQDPAIVFQFDCAGRGRLLMGEQTTEALVEPLQRAFPGKPPWVGFHSYGEIAPVQNKNLFHNATVVLCSLYEQISP